MSALADASASQHPGMFKVMMQLMKLRASCCCKSQPSVRFWFTIRSHATVWTWSEHGPIPLQPCSSRWLAAPFRRGSNSINMWYDADIDPHMRRTMNRPCRWATLPLDLHSSLAPSSPLLGRPLFAHQCKAAFWSAFSVLFYVLVYSMWLKRRTPQNIVIGGLAGSTPPLIGWAAAAGDSIAGSNMLDLGSPVPWMLFFLIFLWTPPHFWALALYRSGEYGKVNIPMMNEVKGAQHTLIQNLLRLALSFGLCALFLAGIRLAVALGICLGWFDPVVRCLRLGH